MDDDVFGSVTEDPAAALAHSCLAVGLPDSQARVLEVVLRREQTTGQEIAAALDVDASTVSRALARLQGQGFVEVVRGRRPAVVSVALGLEDAVRDLVLRRREELTSEQDRVADLTAALDDASEALLGEDGLLRDAVRRRERRGLPALTLEHEDWDGLRRVETKGRHTHDEVLPLWLPGPCLALRCAGRLVVVGDRVDPWALTGLPAGTEVRRAADHLPQVKVLDGQRVGISSSTRWGVTDAWSADPGHVAAAQQLFALWWDAAEPVRVVPSAPVDEAVDPGEEED